MNGRREGVLFTAAVSLLSSCGDVLTLEGGIHRLCQRLPAQRFGVPPIPFDSTAVNAVQLERQFDFDVVAEWPQPLDRAALEVELQTVRLVAVSHGGFSSVRSAMVKLVPPATSSLPAQRVENPIATERTLEFQGNGLSLAPYLESGVLSYAVTLAAASIPQAELAADVEACASVSLRWAYARP
jgi:hypothetical protein